MDIYCRGSPQQWNQQGQDGYYPQQDFQSQQNYRPQPQGQGNFYPQQQQSPAPQQNGQQGWQWNPAPQQNGQQGWQSNPAPQQNGQQGWQSNPAPQQNGQQGWQSNPAPQQNGQPGWQPNPVPQQIGQPGWQMNPAPQPNGQQGSSRSIQQDSFIPQRSPNIQSQQQQPQSSALPGNFQQQGLQNFVQNTQQAQQDFVRRIFIDIFNTSAFLPNLPGGGAPQALLPDLSNITATIQKTGFFFDQNPFFRMAVADLTGKLGGISDPSNFAATVRELESQPDLNRQVWLRASIEAILNRPDTSSFSIPSLLSVNPGFVLPTPIITSAQQQAQQPQAQRQCVTMDGNVGTDNGAENAFWYFREDVMVNSHHWFWHLYYPMLSETRGTRRGELFYAMHHYLLGRYNAERLANGFARTVPFVFQRDATLAEGYRSHLTNVDAAVPWTDRPANTRLPNAIGTFMNITLDDAIAIERLVAQSIQQGAMIASDGTSYSLNNVGAIDALGDTVEATALSINPSSYSRLGVHNTGHVFISNAVDPQGRSPPGVMSETATAMRDIMFYRWHTGIDSLFQTHKDTFAPYQPTGGDLQLSWPGVSLEGFQIVSRGVNQTVNQVRTFWNTRRVELSNGLDFLRNPNAGAVPVCIRHLDHDEFDYQITIRKDPSVQATRAAIRIFLAPRLDENGQRFSMVDQRRLFFVMDTFSVDLQSGVNTFVRRSDDSTLTIHWPQTVTELNSDQNRSRVYCGCGWPHHLLVPRGNPNGMAFDLFAMVTSETDGSIPSVRTTSTPDNCEMAYLFCGIRNQNYPDTKPMTYPFDRLPYSIAVQDQNGGAATTRMVQNLEEYVQGITNVGTTQIQIFHDANRIVEAQ